MTDLSGTEAKDAPVAGSGSWPARTARVSNP